ncbi:MAG: CpsD/CapB family tyrosine-protein kinase [Granulicella sp.]
MQAKGTIGALPATKTFRQLFRDDEPETSKLAKKTIVNGHRLSETVLTATPLAKDAAPSRALAVEQYRLLRTRVLQICRNKRSNIVLITSAIAGDGKTLTAINLGYSIANLSEKRVLYIELDLRRPSAHNLLGIRSEAGAHTFLESDCPWQKCVHKLTDNLDALLAYNPSLTPNETLLKTELASFLQEASKEYDIVLLDTAPLLAAVDTETFLPLINNVLFIVRADKTPIDCVRDALALVGEKVVGIVLNDAKTVKYRDYYYSYQSTRSPEGSEI